MREVAFDLPMGRISALRNDGQGQRVLALHGWLDNAASFLPMAPYLSTLDLVALDLPGHGRSDHFPTAVNYDLTNAMSSVFAVADALEWNRFSLLGHSMGAGISSLMAAACPERIERVVAIEMLGALTEAESNTAARMREGMVAQRRIHEKSLRVFPDMETAVLTRLHANRVPGTGLDAPLVQLLVERGVQEVPGGYSWSSDPQLTLPTVVRMSQAQNDNLLANIDCPVLAIFADPPQMYFPDHERQRRVGLLPDAQLQVFSGGHHLHMQMPDVLAASVLQFLSKPD
jgi:pimeloyl-ACP methyl ester carboxylesterase